MRIAIITNLYPPYARGGAERVVFDDVGAAANRGDEVTVITTRPFAGWRSLKPFLSLEHGVAVYRFFPLNVYHTLNDFKHSVVVHILWHLIDTFNIFSVFVIGRILRKTKPDLVITHNLKGIGMLTPWVVRRLRIPHRHVLHDVQLLTPSGLLLAGHENTPYVAGVPGRWYQRIMCVLWKSPQEIEGLSSWIINAHRSHHFFPDAIFSVRRLIPQALLDRPIAPPRPARVFLFLGQIEAHKGIFDIITAWKGITKPADAHLHIVGEGSALPRVKDLTRADTQITVHGKKTGDELEALWRATHVLVAPSIAYENAPRVILEAFIHHIPVLAADSGGVPELVRPDHNGWLVPPADVPALAATLDKILALC